MESPSEFKGRLLEEKRKRDEAVEQAASNSTPPVGGVVIVVVVLLLAAFGFIALLVIVAKGAPYKDPPKDSKPWGTVEESWEDVEAREYAKVRFTTKPIGARVEVDGVTAQWAMPWGEETHMVILRKGINHDIKVSHPGYETLTAELRITMDHPKRSYLHYSLMPKAEGWKVNGVVVPPGGRWPID